MSQEQYITEKEERKKGKHRDAYERGQIEALKKLGKSNRAITREIGCSPTTIGKELRNGTPERKGKRFALKVQYHSGKPLHEDGAVFMNHETYI